MQLAIKSACCLTSAQIQIGSWKGEHTFVLSGAVTKHEMILGRDFFVKHKVVVDHADNSMVIDNLQINVNTIQTITTKPLVDRTDDETSDVEDPLILANTIIAEPEIATAITTTITIDPSSTIIGKEQTEEQVNLEPSNQNSLICKIHTDTIIRPQSQRLVPFIRNSEATSQDTNDVLMFEPCHPLPLGCLVARSIHSKRDNILYCNLINSNDSEVVLTEGQEIGYLSEAEIALNQFNNDVMNYVPLDTKKLVHSSGKTHSSKPVRHNDNQPIELTTADIKNNEIKNKLKLLKSGKSLKQEQRSLLLSVLKKNIDAFQWNQNEIGRTKLVEHQIPTGNHEPIRQRQYPIPSVARDNMNSQVTDMLKNKFIRPSNSSWRSPVLLVKKKKPDGTIGYRFCIDLKQVNSITTKDCFSLPRISETVDALSGAQFFTTMDIARAFWQIGLAEEDKKKTVLSWMVNYLNSILCYLEA